MKILKTNKLLAACLLAALSSAPIVASTDISHNWVADSESAAMGVFRDKYVALGGQWQDSTFPDTEASISSTKTRIIGGKPPMALQASLGRVLGDFAEAGMLQNMNNLAANGNWSSNISASMAQMGQFEGQWVAAPVFVDVINWMYTNNDVLAAAGVSAPTTWAEFTASLAKLKAAGKIPLAIGGQSWQEAILFDHVLLSVGGTELYDGLMSGNPEVLEGNQIRTALEQFVDLRQYTDEGKSGRSWNDTNTLLLSGKAAYFFMGPWASGSYADLGDEGGQWSCRLTPWNQGMTIVADGFLFIKVDDAADRKAQNLFAQAVMDPATQIAAAKAKGTLPATTSASASDFSGCPAKAVNAMASRSVVTHWNGRSSKVADAVKDAVSALWNGLIDLDTAQQQMVVALK